MKTKTTYLTLPLAASLLAGCAALAPRDAAKLECTMPVAVYPDSAKPLERRATVLVRAMITASGNAENVAVTTSSRNAAADRAAVDAMSKVECTQTPARGGERYPFTLTRPFVFEPSAKTAR
ncbi:energy transducer TonB [Burkholderia sp. MSMB617WGS]|uniref:TonB family protein n=1 Tax=Burkholderia sp. MSMB617WGS TaxID=1637831 RepID=UPI0007600B78|nr:TonB family protein [Burkholderia sp. MSMB617WGS]AOK47967.1 energy transducer TonB [Burkholderia sp. MSMB617WGS]